LGGGSSTWIAFGGARLPKRKICGGVVISCGGVVISCTPLVDVEVVVENLKQAVSSPKTSP